MTKITFIGTGEAFDPYRVNSSYLIKEGNKNLLVDCGFDVAKSLMRYLDKTDSSLIKSPNGVLFTHAHGDHSASLSGLLIPILEEVNGIVGKDKQGLERKIDIIGPSENVLNKLKVDVNEDYSEILGTFGKIGPDINWRKFNSGEQIYGMGVECAKTSHSVENYAYKFTNQEGKSFAISGDGAMSEESQKLYKGVDLLIHEGFYITKDGGDNHSSVKQVVDYASANKIPEVYIIHVNREERRKIDEISEMKNFANRNGVNLQFPEDSNEIIL